MASTFDLAQGFIRRLCPVGYAREYVEDRVRATYPTLSAAEWRALEPALARCGATHRGAAARVIREGLGYGGHGEPSDKQRAARDYERGREDAARELRSFSDEDIREYLASTRSEGGAYQRGCNEVARERLGGLEGLSGFARGLAIWNR